MKRLTLAFAIIALLAAVAIAFSFPRPSDTYEVTAYFSKTIGLFTKSDVRVLGVNVGEVSAVVPMGDRVKVVMRISKERKLPASATAIVIPISLISDRYIQIAPPYTDGPTLQDGAVLTVDQTAIPAELDDLLIALKTFLDALETGDADDPGALGEAVDALAAALKGTGSDLDETLGSLGTVGRVVNARAAEIDGAVVSLSDLVASLAQRKDQISSLNSRLATALGAVAEERSSLDGALTNIALLTEQLGGIVKAHRSTLEADLLTLSNTTQAVMRHQTSLIKANDWLHVLADGGEASHNMGAVHREGQSSNPGITHIDVRETHYGVCPVPFLGCNLLPGGVFPASGSPDVNASADPSPGPSERATEPPAYQLPPILEDPLRKLPAVQEILPAGPVAMSVPGVPPPMTERKADRGRAWFLRLGDWLDRVLGGSR